MAQVVPQPLPPAALAAVGAAAPPAIQQPPTTYGAKFAGMGDPYNGAYLPLLEAHRPAANPSPATVTQTALSLSAHEGLPGVYAYQVPVTNEIRTIHRLSQTSSLPGLASPWDGMIFAFEGEVAPPGLINLVQLPANAFHLATPAVLCPTAATLSERWTEIAANVPCVGPFGVGDDDVVAITTRRFMPVPYAYVHLMHDRVLSPRQLWQQVGEQIGNDGRAADCEIFLNWILAACTFRPPAVVGEPLVASVAQPAPLTVPLADAALKQQMWAWLVHDLPALAVTPATPVEDQLVLTTAAVRQELALARASAEAARVEARAPKTMSSAYPTMTPPLRRLCGVDSDAALPVFWQEHAACGGKKYHSLACLQQLVTDRANEATSAQGHVVISVALFESIAQFRLGSPDLDNVSEGFSPFKICTPHYHLAAGTRLECNTYGLLTSGSGVAAMSEMRELSEPKILAPRDGLELIGFVAGYSCLLDCLIGADHGAAARLRNHAIFWRQNAPSLANMHGPENLAGMLMQVMRTLQLITLDYINAALQFGTAAPLPNYGRIEDAVRQRTWQSLSQMPAHCLEAKAAPVHTKQSTTPTAAPTATSTTPANNRALSVRSDAPKAHQNSDWATKFAASEKEIKDLKLDKARPKICLSYHLRGTCFESCGEHATHRALTAAEKAAVQTFLEKSL